MAVSTLPVNRDSLNFAIRVVLDESPFRMDFRFNPRDNSWYFDVKDDQGVQLRTGVKITSQFPLLYRMTTRPLPRGDLIVIPRTTGVEEAGRLNFGTDAPLYYIDSETLLETLG